MHTVCVYSVCIQCVYTLYSVCFTVTAIEVHVIVSLLREILCILTSESQFVLFSRTVYLPLLIAELLTDSNFFQ